MKNNHRAEINRVLRTTPRTWIFLCSVLLGIATIYLSFNYLVYPNLTPYQKFYYQQYQYSFFKSQAPFQRAEPFTLLTYTTINPETNKREDENLWLEMDMVIIPDSSGNIPFDERGNPVFRVATDSINAQREFSYKPKLRMNSNVYGDLKKYVYKREYYEYFYLPMILGLVSFFTLFVTCFLLKTRNIRKKIAGKHIRGMHLHTVKKYQEKTKKLDGFYISVITPDVSPVWLFFLWNWIRPYFAPVYQLRLPQEKEDKGTFISGDSGTGKSTFINQVIDYARAWGRRQPGVCFDPSSEFIQSHFQEKKDFIINPFDARFPNWELKNEIKNYADLSLIAESFIPTPPTQDEKSLFFVKSTQEVLKLILAQRCSNKEYIEILSNPAAIDELVEGTEIAYKIDPKAHAQKAGILGALSDVGEILRNIPPPQAGRKMFSFTDWVNGGKHSSWLFFSMTAEKRNALRPFISAMLNLLLYRLMSNGKRHNAAWWFIADELHNLNSLPALPSFVVECRDQGVRYVLGTQSKHQLIPQYGHNALTILSQANLKIYYRSNEPEAARWISQSIGIEELDRLQVTESISTDSQRHSSVNFQNITVNRSLFIPEEIMSLPDLHGVWKFGKDIVPFRMQYKVREKRHPAFIPHPFQRELKAKILTTMQGDRSVQKSSEKNQLVDTPVATQTNTANSTETKKTPVVSTAKKTKSSDQKTSKPSPGKIRLNF